MSTILSPRRSLLFTPANRPALFTKALESGADMIIIDLEDAVAADQKEASRSGAIDFLKVASDKIPERIIRINSFRTDEGQSDIAAIIEARPTTGTLLIPKIEAVEEIQEITNILKKSGSSLNLAIMIETIMGVENCFEIFKPSLRLNFVMFGGADLAAELGTTIAMEPLAYGRARLVYAAKHAQVDVFDMPCLNFKDLDAVRTEAEHARLLGFTGKAVIHPSNIDSINRAFTPTKEEMEEAQRFVVAYQKSTTGVAVIDGKLVEKPIVRAMEIILARGQAAGLKP
ncbi:MAG: HpcH/HpaI aldolase/citrate lyase family protein [Gammaproteobacteria bacterium]|jgi:citrate lyase beta subunit